MEDDIFQYLRNVNEKKLQEAVQNLKSGEFEKALIQFNVLIEQTNDDPDLFSYRGAVLLNLKRKQEALNDFNKSVSLQPDYSYRYSSRAFAKDAMGDLTGAIADYEKAIELDPEDAIAHNNLGLLIEKSGNQASAKKHFESADELAKKFFGSDLEDSSPHPGEGISLQPQKLKPDPRQVSKEMYWNQLTRIFTSKKEFKKFIAFLFKGGSKTND